MESFVSSTSTPKLVYTPAPWQSLSVLKKTPTFVKEGRMLPSHIPMECRNGRKVEFLVSQSQCRRTVIEHSYLIVIPCQNHKHSVSKSTRWLAFRSHSLGSKDSRNPQYRIVSMRHHVPNFDVFLIVNFVFEFASCNVS